MINQGCEVMLPCCDVIKYAINMRSQNIEFDKLNAFTRDKVEIEVDG